MRTIILTDNLGFSESNYEIFVELNKIINNTPYEVAISYFDLSNTLIPLDVPVVNVAELSSFSNGLMVATTVKGAAEILSCVNNSRKLLFLWDIDWAFDLYDFEWLYDVITNPKLEVICRSSTHKDLITKMFGRSVLDVQQDFKLEKIWNLLENTKKK